MYKNVYSEFEVDKFSLRFDTAGEDGNVVKGKTQNADCIGSMEEEMENKVITKKCRGRKQREIVKGTGNGSLKISIHMPYVIYTKMYGMDTTKFADGIKAYGQDSVHPEAVLTARVKDEDGIVKYKAYPRAVVTTAKATKVNNGDEEVAEIEVNFDILPDDNGIGMYEILETEASEEIKSGWMENWDTTLIAKSA